MRGVAGENKKVHAKNTTQQCAKAGSATGKDFGKRDSLLRTLQKEDRKKARNPKGSEKEDAPFQGDVHQKYNTQRQYIPRISQKNRKQRTRAKRRKPTPRNHHPVKR